jgi:hypothetical protein
MINPQRHWPRYPSSIVSSSPTKFSSTHRRSITSIRHPYSCNSPSHLLPNSSFHMASNARFPQKAQTKFLI